MSVLDLIFCLQLLYPFFLILVTCLLRDRPLMLIGCWRHPGSQHTIKAAVSLILEVNSNWLQNVSCSPCSLVWWLVLGTLQLVAAVNWFLFVFMASCSFLSVMTDQSFPNLVAPFVTRTVEKVASRGRNGLNKESEDNRQALFWWCAYVPFHIDCHLLRPDLEEQDNGFWFLSYVFHIGYITSTARPRRLPPLPDWDNTLFFFLFLFVAFCCCSGFFAF